MLVDLSSDCTENCGASASKMDISNIMCLLALLLCCTYLSLIQNQIGAAVLFKILALILQLTAAFSISVESLIIS